MIEQEWANYIHFVIIFLKDSFDIKNHKKIAKQKTNCIPTM